MSATASIPVSCEPSKAIPAAESVAPGNKTQSAGDDFKKKLEDCEAEAAAPLIASITIPAAAGAAQEAPPAYVPAQGIAAVQEPVAPGTAVEMQPVRIPLQGMRENNAPAQTAVGVWQAEAPDTGDTPPEQSAAPSQETPPQVQNRILSTIGLYVDESIRQEKGRPAAAPAPFPTVTANVATGETRQIAPAEMPPADGRVGKQNLPAQYKEPDGTAATQMRSMPLQAGSEPQPIQQTTAGRAFEQEPAVAYTKENVLSIVNKVQIQKTAGRYDFDVELKPDFLGKVHIKLTMEGDSIRMHIKTEDSAVQNMLADQTASLRSLFKEKGIPVTNVEVSCESQAWFDGSGQPFNRGGGERRRQPGAYAVQAGGAAGGTEAAEESYYHYLGDSSMEFLA